MRRAVLGCLIFLCLALTAEAAVEHPSWTGNNELDAAFALNNQGRYAEAFAAFSTLYERGVPMAGTMLGRYYEDGRAVPPDAGKALGLFHEARDKGDQLAAFHLERFGNGDGFVCGPGIEDLMEAVEAAAERGNVPLQAALAAAYLVRAEACRESDPPPSWNPPNPGSRAAYWMRRAAEAGYAPCQFNMYAHKLDPGNGVAWLRKAAEAGYPAARKELERLRDRPGRGFR